MIVKRNDPAVAQSIAMTIISCGFASFFEFMNTTWLDRLQKLGFYENFCILITKSCAEPNSLQNASEHTSQTSQQALLQNRKHVGTESRYYQTTQLGPYC